MRASLFYLPTVGDRSEIEQGGAGLRRELHERPDLLGEGLALVGSPDSAAHQRERLFERLPCRWLFCWESNGLVPDDALRRSIELFAMEVIPKVDDVLEPPPAALEMVPAR
jgi:hypothetical protein